MSRAALSQTDGCDRDAHGGIPYLFQIGRLHGKSSGGNGDGLSGNLPRICARAGDLNWDRCSRRTAKFSTEETFRRLLDIPEMKGIKHSSLDRLIELKRLALRDAHRPDFRIYTGNDLGINMIEYGSDYLLGLATFAPEKFAESGPSVGGGRPGLLCAFGCAAISGKCGVSRASSCVQAFCSGVSESDRKNSLRSDAPQKPQAISVGDGDFAGLRTKAEV